MNMDDLPSNNADYTTQSSATDASNNIPRMKPSINKNILKKEEKGFISGMLNSFFDRDVVEEVIKPGIKNLALDGLEMIFFHDGGRRRRNGYYQDYYDYDRPSYRYGSSNSYRDDSYGYDYRRDNYGRDQDNRQNNKRPDYRNLIITTDHIGTERARDEAYKVVRDLRARCEEFHRFSIADVYDAVGYAGDYTDNDWGWTDPQDVNYRRVSSGYLIEFMRDPRPLR